MGLLASDSDEQEIKLKDPNLQLIVILRQEGSPAVDSSSSALNWVGGCPLSRGAPLSSLMRCISK